MIDWHSHILPEMDDGSQSIEESLEMLKMMRNQGVDIVVATPHFYADNESVDEFIERREHSYELLREVLPENSPKIVLGAEVAYYFGVTRHQDIRKLRIEGSKTVLLEMPMNKWSEYTVNEIAEFAGRGRGRVLLAHVERYMGMQSSKTINRLNESGVLMQVNASYFLRRTTKRKALSQLKKGEIHLIGSDAHNITTRMPCDGDAANLIKKKLGGEILDRVDEHGQFLLNRF